MRALKFCKRIKMKGPGEHRGLLEGTYKERRMETRLQQTPATLNATARGEEKYVANAELRSSLRKKQNKRMISSSSWKIGAQRRAQGRRRA